MGRLAVSCYVVLGIFLLFHSVIHALVNQSVFQRTSLQGSADITFLKRWTVRSKVECAVACSGRSECKSFSVRPRTWECSLYSSRITAADVLPAPSSEQEVFFWKERGVCPIDKGYAIIPGTHMCLRIHEEAKNWTAAEATCEAEGGHLATIEDLVTWGAMRDYLEGAGLSTGIYMGGLRTSAGQWLWVDGRAVEESFWIPGQPQDSNVWSDLCISLWWTNRQNHFIPLDDIFCGNQMIFLCEV